MQAHAIELIAGKRWALRGSLSAAPVLPLTQALHHKGIHLVELPVGVSRPEIVPPAAKYGGQFRDNLLHVLPALPLAGEFAHAFPEFLGRFGAWPPLHEMQAGVALNAPLLTNRASQEPKALLPAAQVHQPRLRWMQR